MFSLFFLLLSWTEKVQIILSPQDVGLVSHLGNGSILCKGREHFRQSQLIYTLTSWNTVAGLGGAGKFKTGVTDPHCS